MDNIVKKTFWEKPEGKTGALILTATAAGAALVGWFYLLPFLITLLANTILAGVLAAVIVTLFFVVMNKHFQMVVSHIFKRSMFKLTDAIIVIDPIGVLRIRVATMWERVKKMDEVKHTLTQQIRITRSNIQRNEVERQKSAAGAQSTKSKSEFFLQSRQAGRLERSNVSAREWLTKLETMDKLIAKYIELTTVFAKDSDAEADVQERDRKQLLANYNVYKAAQRAMAGQEDELEMFNRTLEYLVADNEKKFAEVEGFVDMIDSVVSSLDMESGIFDQDAINSFETWERKADSLLLGPGDQQRFLHAIDATPREAVPVTEAGRRSYADFFADTSKKDGV